MTHNIPSSFSHFLCRSSMCVTTLSVCNVTYFLSHAQSDRRPSSSVCLFVCIYLVGFPGLVLSFFLDSFKKVSIYPSMYLSSFFLSLSLYIYVCDIVYVVVGVCRVSLTHSRTAKNKLFFFFFFFFFSCLCSPFRRQDVVSNDKDDAQGPPSSRLMKGQATSGHRPYFQPGAINCTSSFYAYFLRS